jgi:hypothetical protein
MNKQRIAAAIVAISLSTPVLASEASQDGANFPPAQNLNYFHAPGADQVGSPSLAPTGTSSTYLFVAGSAFTPRSSAQTVSYPGAGCTYSNDAVTTDVQLPNGSSVFGVRLYYYDLNTTGGVGLFFTNYDGAGEFVDLLNQGSTLESGYSSEYFALPEPAVIDNAGGSYVLSSTMSPNLRFCGARIFYSLP